MQNTDKSIFFRVAVCLAFLFTLGLTSLSAQTDDKFSFDLTLNSDQFFGFYPFFAGSYEVSDASAFTFYGILWSGGTGGGWGNWSEFGVGMNFTVTDGLDVNPQVGVLGGNLLSSGTAGQAVFGDGIVPNLTIGLDKESVEGEFYLGYYLPLRDLAPANGSTLTYLHYWANFGVKASSFFSLGAHWEQLSNTARSDGGDTGSVYQWIGPYVQFSAPSGKAFARIAAGGDLVEGNDSFFKITTGFSF